MAGKRNNGEGTIYRRKDGRFAGAVYVLTPGGVRKRVQVYGKTWEEAHNKLADAMVTARQGLPVADRKVRLGDYLDYWLENFVKVNQRPKTYAEYEWPIRLYLKPGLGKHAISDLTVPMVQAFLNKLLAETGKLPTVRAVRTTLGAAITRAQREELINRNVAHLVELPKRKRKEIKPWTASEAAAFLEASQNHALYPAFQLLVLLGLRRGEVLGLRWCDIDFEQGEIRIRQSLQRIPHVGLVLGDAKTDSGRRDLPMLDAVRRTLVTHRALQAQRRAALGDKWGGPGDGMELAFTSARGTWMDPDNFARCFHSICQEHGIRKIKMHHIRHSFATRLKELGIPLKDAQGVLGHADVTTTMAIYQHEDMTSRTAALERVENLFERVLVNNKKGTSSNDSYRCCQSSCQPLSIIDAIQATLSVFRGASDGIRTRDLLDHNQAKSNIHDRLQSVKSSMEVCTRQWMVGVVAVNLAVKNEWSAVDITAEMEHDVRINLQATTTDRPLGSLALGMRTGSLFQATEGSSESVS